jgi:hypothetical protein
MALLVAWLSLGACTLLGVACVLLYLDNRGRRGVERAALRALRLLSAQVAAQEEELGSLRRAVAGLAAPDLDVPRAVVLPPAFQPRPPSEPPVRRLTLELPIPSFLSEDEHATMMAPEPPPPPSSRRNVRATLVGGFVPGAAGSARE